ncbi:MAG: 50S ribosomal protein L33 [Candidatus Aerophobetes bacterium]|nr:50S ribosomal protein L33 [Candidatus Aerophobetes bacterium]
MGEIVTLICTKCKRRNYTTTRNKKTPSLTLKKFCKGCRRYTPHKEK